MFTRARNFLSMDKLPWQCEVDQCENPRMGTLTMCASHLQALRKDKRELSKPVKERKSLKKVSDKRKPELDRYNREVAIWKRGRYCRMCEWAGLMKHCDHAHHAAGREGKLLMDKSKWVPLCGLHHIWVTEHSKEAIELGISLPRNQTI